MSVCGSCGGVGGERPFVWGEDPRTGEYGRQSPGPCPDCGKKWEGEKRGHVECAKSGGPTVRCWGRAEFYEGNEWLF